MSVQFGPWIIMDGRFAGRAEDMRLIKCSLNERGIESVRVTTVAVEKTISITYTECVPITLIIQRAKHMRRIVICDLSGCIMFFHIIS
jgi:hypothetical protein